MLQFFSLNAIAEIITPDADAFKGWEIIEKQESEGALLELCLKAVEYKKSNITYNLDGGTNASTNPSIYYEGKTVIELAVTTKTGYTFDGWYSDKNYTTKVTSIPITKTGNITLYARFVENAPTYEITTTTEKATTHEKITTTEKTTTHEATTTTEKSTTHKATTTLEIITTPADTLQESTENIQPKDTAEESHSPKVRLIVVLLIFIVIILCTIAGIIVYHHKSDNSSSTH